jgi:hypothetical protein
MEIRLVDQETPVPPNEIIPILVFLITPVTVIVTLPKIELTGEDATGVPV